MLCIQFLLLLYVPSFCFFLLWQPLLISKAFPWKNPSTLPLDYVVLLLYVINFNTKTCPLQSLMINTLLVINWWKIFTNSIHCTSMGMLIYTKQIHQRFLIYVIFVACWYYASHLEIYSILYLLIRMKILTCVQYKYIQRTIISIN